jgi:hypothetical protein
LRVYRLDRRPPHIDPDPAEAIYRLLPRLKRGLTRQRPTLAESHHEIWAAIHKDNFDIVSKSLFETMGGCDAAKSAAQNKNSFHIVSLS